MNESLLSIIQSKEYTLHSVPVRRPLE